MTQNKTKMMILTALFAALTAVGAFIKIPIPPVPVTMQVFFVVMAGIILGPRWGLCSQLVYIFTGLIGIPIFTAGGGIGYVVYPTFGYLIGFAIAAYVVGLMTQKAKQLTFKTCFLASFVGLLISLVFGTAYMYAIYNLYLGAEKTAMWAVSAGFIPFLIGDTILMAIVSVLSIRIVTVLKKANLYPSAK